MSTVTQIPTVDDVRRRVADAIEHIQACDYLSEYTIADYPIGRRDRGKCRLRVQHHPKKGFRTERTTTDKRGVWCKPKCSTFGGPGEAIAVTTGLRSGYKGQLVLGLEEAGWMQVSHNGASVVSANERRTRILEAPLWRPPQRERRVDVIIMRPIFGGGEERQEVVTEADPPELCDAYDAFVCEWAPHFKAMVEQMKYYATKSA